MKVSQILAGLAIALVSFAASADWTIGFGPNAKNPNTFGVINIQTPKAPMTTASKVDPDGVTRQYLYSCQVGQTLGFAWEGTTRQFRCRSQDGTVTAANEALVSNGVTGSYGGTVVNGVIYANGGRCPPGTHPNPWVPGTVQTCWAQ